MHGLVQRLLILSFTLGLVATMIGAQESGNQDQRTDGAEADRQNAAVSDNESSRIVTDWEVVNDLERPVYGEGTLKAPPTKRRLQVSAQGRANVNFAAFAWGTEGGATGEAQPLASYGFLLRVDRFYASALTFSGESAAVNSLPASELSGTGWEVDNLGNVEPALPSTWILGAGVYQDLVQTGRTAVIAAYGGLAATAPVEEYGMDTDIGLSLGLEMYGGFGRLRNIGWSVNAGLTQFLLGKWGTYAQTVDGSRSELAYANDRPLFEIGYSILFRPVMGYTVDSFGQMRSNAIWHIGRRGRIGGAE